MVDLIVYAIPAFVVLLALEMLAFNYARDDHDMVGYESRDTREILQGASDVGWGVRGAKRWRDRFGYVFRGPGWSPDGRRGGTRG